MFFRTLGYRVNLATGETRSIESEERPHLDRIQVSNTGRTVSDTGTAVFFDSRNIYVLQGDEISAIPTLGIVFDAVIDAAADKIVFSSGGPCSDVACPTAPTEVRITSPGASGSLLLASGYAPSMTDDGRQVLYLSDRTGSTADLHNRNGWSGRPAADQRGRRDHARHPFGRRDGLVCRNRIREIDPDCDGGRNSARVDSVHSVFGNVIQCGLDLFDASLPVLAPNKLVTLPGVGLSTSAATAAPPLPSSLGGVQVNIQGITAKIAGVAPDSVTVIVPPGVTPDAAAVVQMNVDTQTPFEAARTTTVSAFSAGVSAGSPAAVLFWLDAGGAPGLERA